MDGDITVAAERIELSYPDGARDAEAVVLATDGTPVVITKATFDRTTQETGPTELFAAPGYGSGTMAPLGTLDLPDPRTPLAAGFVGTVVTAADAQPDRVLVRTYDAVYSYARPSGAPLSGLPQWPVTELPAPREGQAEALAADTDGCGYLTTAEGTGVIWQVSCS